MNAPNDEGTAAFRLIPDGAILYRLDVVAFTTLKGGRYVAMPDAIAALREIVERGDVWSRQRARAGLGGWT
jgi:hypothetical protein